MPETPEQLKSIPHLDAVHRRALRADWIHLLLAELEAGHGVGLIGGQAQTPLPRAAEAVVANALQDDLRALVSDLAEDGYLWTPPGSEERLAALARER